VTGDETLIKPRPDRTRLAWIDIDYTPQVQYLLPFKRTLEERGYRVVVTARDIGLSHELLREAGVPFEAVGGSFGVKTWRKASGTLLRARELTRLARRTAVPDLVIATGRSATLAARFMRRASFAIVDYEHVNVTIHRFSDSVLFFPDVIDAEAFLTRGLDPRQLIPFAGLKEDLSFGAIDTHAVPAHEFTGIPDGAVRVLVRPPTEESHYYRRESRDLTLAALERLSVQDDVVVILSPRHPWQVADLERCRWRNQPVVLDKAVPFVELLKAVDVVVAAGGTMVREAAYLGVPTYSLFQGQIGQVDRYLEQLGRIEMLTEVDDLDKLSLRRRDGFSPMPRKPWLVGELADRMLEHTTGRATSLQPAEPRTT
jgi:predicted glycosyltransferase